MPDSDASVDGRTPEAFKSSGDLKSYYRNPYTQIVMVGFVCFMGPGLFSALNGLGGAGQADETTAAKANVAIYSTFTVTAFFAGTIINKLGSRWSLSLGVLGYSVYMFSYLAGSLWPNNNMQLFTIASGAVLGVSAGLLWDAQGSLMLSYPTEAQKGRFVGIFWMIFNLGGVFGAAIALAQNINSTSASISTATYAGFVSLTLLGSLLPLLMIEPRDMHRTDGSKVRVPLHPSWREAFGSLAETVSGDWAVVALFPLFFASNFFYAWQHNDYNFALFNIRTRALNNLCYWFSQIFGALIFGLLLDTPRVPRRMRAFLGWALVVVMIFVIHAWAYRFQVDFTRESTADPSFVKIDFMHDGYAPYLWLYIAFGALDAILQTAVYWFIGALSNDPTTLAHYSGFYKSVQSAGAAVAWRLDSGGFPYMTIFALTWAILAGGFVIAAPMLYWRISDHTVMDYEPL